MKWGSTKIKFAQRILRYISKLQNLFGRKKKGTRGAKINIYYEGHLESKERFAIQRYLLTTEK